MSTPATETSLSLEERREQRRLRRFDEATQSRPAAERDEQELISRVEQQNAIFKVFEDRQLSQEQKIQEIARLLQFDAADPDNDRKVEMLSEFFEYVQLQRRNMALGQITTVSDQAYATFKQNMDSVFEDLNIFKASIAPLDEVLALLKKFRTGENAGKKSVIEQINDAFRQQKMLKEARVQREADVARIEESVTKFRRDYERARQAFAAHDSLVGRIFRPGLLKEMKAGIEQIEKSIAAQEAKLNDLKSAPLFVPGTATPIDQKILDMEQQNPEILKVLDIGGELFGKNMKVAAETGVSFIKEAEDRIGVSIEGFQKVRENILQLNYQNNKISVLLAVISKGLELATRHNKEVVGALIEKFGNPDAPEADQTAQTRPEGVPEDITADIERTKARNRIQNMNRFLARLGDLGINLTRSSGELSQQGAVITDLERKNSSAINYAMSIRSQTIATTSTRVVTLLNSIVNTVLTEKAGLIEDALDHMSQEASMVLTDEIRATPELLKKRRGALEGQIADIEDLSEAVSETTATLIEVLKQTRTLADEVHRSAEELNQITLQSTRAELDAQRAAPGAEPAGKAAAAREKPDGRKGIDALFDT